ncbi:MAG: hypothetical protein HRT91_04260 [Piscirickettsiaceae bacterium]|nr:hypothetical protein [Piscirickettsiaceae bacterium]
MQLYRLLTTSIVSVCIAGCSNGGLRIDGKTRLKMEMDANLTSAINSVLQLSDSLQKGTISNAIVLTSYAKMAMHRKPEFEDIIMVLASEGTVNGPTYISIENRLKRARRKISISLKYLESSNSLNKEFRNIIDAVHDYDIMLVDAINVLSDFTSGKLPKMRELQYEGKAVSTAPPGSEYIGNTNYGQWTQDSSGHSFWAFYVQYAMFSALFRGVTYYDRWSINRRPSYYHDYGRDSYSSPLGKSNHTDTLQKTKKKYNLEGKTFISSYSRSHPTIKGEAPGTKPIFKSSYARSIPTINSSEPPYTNTSHQLKSSNRHSYHYNSRSSSRRRSSYGGGK